MNIKIRPATSSDIKALDEFQNKLVVYERPFTPTIRRKGKIRYYNIQKLISSDKSLLLVAEDGDNLVGCCFGEIRNNEDWSVNKFHGYIGLMFTEEKYRSKGIGKLLIGKILEWLKGKKIKDIRLRVYDKNTKAIDFYKGLGFENHILEMFYEEKKC